MRRPLFILGGVFVCLAVLAGAGIVGFGSDRPLLAALPVGALGLGAGLLATGLIPRRRNGAESSPDASDSDALFRNLFELSPFPAAISRLTDGTLLAVNQRVLDRFGLSPDEAIGASARDFYASPEDRDRLIAAVRAKGRAEETVRLRSPSGECFWATISARQVTYRNEPAIFGVFHDVDARVKAEQVLKESEHRLAVQSEALTELTSAGTSGGVSFDERLRNILESCARTLEVERVSVWRFMECRSGIHCVDLFEATSGRHSAVAGIPRTGHCAYFEALECERLIAADDARRDPRTCEFDEGYLRPVGIGAMLDVPIRSDDQTVGVLCLEHIGGTRTWTVDEQNFALSVANLVAAATADEDRRAALRRLEESEHRARLVVDTATAAFVGIDSDGNIDAWNAQAERTFGWSREEVIGQPLVTTIIPPSFREAHLQGMRRFYATGKAPVVGQHLELMALHRDGHEFPVELSISEPIRRGDKFSFSAFLRDISEPRRRQEELRRAKESAEAATRAKSEFLANMSHELRTPLNGVLGYAQLLRRDRTLSPNHREAVESIAACGAHLLDLINDVLDLSKIEAGRVEVEAVSTAIDALVADLRLMIVEPARRKDLAFEVEIAPDLPRRVVLDGPHLRQVLINLLGNAVKFTQQGGVRLLISSDGPKLRFDVVDTGVGIESQEHESIFDAFRQTRTGAAAGGTGLGLTISQRLVRAMGGELHVESQPGRGSRFWFALPLVADIRDEAPPAPDHAPDLRLAPGQEVTVLVVDDSTINRRIMAGLLESAGIRTLSAAGGAEAIRIARAQQPDLVLMDLRMAEMDGFEATRRLRADPATADIVVVAITASPDENTKEKALAAGCRDFLSKPLRAAELYGSLSRHLDARFEPLEVAAKPQPGLPAPPAAIAERIRRAAAIGGLSELNAIATELAAGDESLARLGRQVAHLANAFEFEALERMASGSESESRDVQPAQQ